MSSDIAQAPNEDYTFSKSIADDLPPNTHLESPGAGTYGKMGEYNIRLLFQCSRRVLIARADSVFSSANPTASSDYDSPTSLAPSDAQAQDTSANLLKGGESSNYQPAAISGGNREENTGPAVPIRLSSNAKLPTLGANSMIEQTTVPPISTSRRNSKGSFKPKSRSGSNASKLSRKEQVNTQAGTQAEDETTPPRKKKRGGLFALLNCCSAPENANSVGGDQAEPAKKANRLQQKPGRQATPVVKPNASAAESSATESKIAEEGIGGPEYSELKAAAKPTMITRSSKEKVMTEKPASQNAFTQPPVSVTKETSAPTENRDPPLPPLPLSNIASTQEGDMSQGMPSAQAAGVESPPQLIEPEESVAEQGTTINDRTPIQEQRDSDIAMVDAPPVVQAVEEQPKSAQELAQAQTALPPPPPRNGLNRDLPVSNSVVPNEQQKWLLPPLQPRFHGRKCLVLDLDETLVHSSFKVGYMTTAMIWI